MTSSRTLLRGRRAAKASASKSKATNTRIPQAISRRAVLVCTRTHASDFQTFSSGCVARPTQPPTLAPKTPILFLSSNLSSNVSRLHLLRKSGAYTWRGSLKLNVPEPCVRNFPGPIPCGLPRCVAHYFRADEVAHWLSFFWERPALGKAWKGSRAPAASPESRAGVVHRRAPEVLFIWFSVFRKNFPFERRWGNGTFFQNTENDFERRRVAAAPPFPNLLALLGLIVTRIVTAAWH